MSVLFCLQLLFLAITSSAANAEEFCSAGFEFTKNEVGSGCARQTLSGAQIKDGLWKTQYDNGQKKEEGRFREGRKEGKWKEWFPNGNLRSLKHFKEGRRFGISKTFRRDATLATSGSYLNDRKNGIWKEFDEEGELTAKYHYEEGGIASGEHKDFHPNGAIKKLTFWKNGKKNGVESEWTDSKVQTAERNFVNGLEHGVTHLWYKSGILAERVEYASGLREGVRKVYYKDGVLKFEGTYTKGMLEGPASYFDLAGDERYRLLFRKNLMSKILEGRVAFEKDRLLENLIEVKD